MRYPALFLLAASLTLAEEVKVRGIGYSQDKTPLKGVWVPPPAGAKSPAPAILLFPDWMGVTPDAVDLAKRVSKWGYAVLVADMYGSGKRPKNAQEAGKLSAAMKGDVPLLRKRALAALAVLKTQGGIDTNKVAAMGFCFGGTTTLELARSGAALKGVVSVHGALNTPLPEDAKKIRGKILVLHGAEDPHVPPEQVQNFMDEMRAAQTDWHMTFYGGAVHAFTNPKAGLDPKQGAAYNAKADRRAFEAMKDFFAETL